MPVRRDQSEQEVSVTSGLQWLKIRYTRDKVRILAYLERDRLYNGYAICDLAPPLDRQSDWYIAYRNGSDGQVEEIAGLCLHFHGFAPHPLSLEGDGDALHAILATALQPSPVYLVCRPEHMEFITGHYQLEQINRMLRMAVDRRRFRPVADLRAEARCERLRPTDLGELRQLYENGEGNLFNQYMLHDGVFYGIWQDDRMVSVAGTHCIAPHYGIGAVGNVFTHTAYRGRGYARACVSAVTAELFARHRCRDVILNVNTENIPAIRAYERLGYYTYCSFIEGPAQLQPERWPPWSRKGRRLWKVDLSDEQAQLVAYHRRQ